MEILKSSKEGVEIITTKERIQMTDSVEFENELKMIEKTSLFIVDLSETTYLCSMALGAMIATKRRITRAGGTMKIVAASGSVLDVLRLTMIDKVIPVEATLENAIRCILKKAHK